MSMRHPALSPYEDGRMSNRQRRALKGPSRRERRSAAQGAQAVTGRRIRISRPVKNQLDFKPELKAWHEPVQAGIAKRKSLGSLAMTVFDTRQQPLRFGAEHTEESLEGLLYDSCPALFEDCPPVPVTGTGLYGSKIRPFVALTLGPGPIYGERSSVRDAIAPELSLDDSHQLGSRPHVSLGQVFAAHQAVALQAKLEPVLPQYVEFGPALIELTLE